MKLQKRLAARVLGISKARVKCAPENRETISEAITKHDMRKLIRDGVVKVLPKHGGSKARTRAHNEQKKKGRRRGLGVRKGKAGARLKRKRNWINRIRAQRKLIADLKEKKLLTTTNYTALYRKAKGGFFRSVNHIKLYIKEHSMLEAKK